MQQQGFCFKDLGNKLLWDHTDDGSQAMPAYSMEALRFQDEEDHED